MLLSHAASYYFLGASTPCCQGTNPAPTTDRFCGWWFNIDPLATIGVNQPLCGECYRKIIFSTKLLILIVHSSLNFPTTLFL